MIALVVLTQEGLNTARRVRDVLGDARIYGRSGRVTGADESFDDTIALIRDLFTAGTPVAGFCAAGIMIRALAPLLTDKWAEPPVLAVAEDGSSTVPLLGGHRGANRLAGRIAALLNGHAAVTTAGDLRTGAALDDPPPGWHLANPDRVKPVAAAILAGAPVHVRCEAGDPSWLPDIEPSGEDASHTVLITDRAVAPDAGTLLLHPPTLAVGIGAERDVPAAEGAEAVEAVLRDNGLSPVSVAAIGSIDIKADEPAVLAAADALDLDARFFDAATLNAEAGRLLNPSDLVVMRETGCPGVSEGAALALSGPDGDLVVPKTRVGRVTVAVARARDVGRVTAGRAGGRLDVVGVGPGQRAWRTAEAVQALQRADEVVGYGLYLDLVDDLIAGKPAHRSPLGDETGRVDFALERAATGKRVALICSGDPGIFALATLVYERLDRAEDRAVRGVKPVVVPGISAFQAAAARLGAPMGHDFCLISLSDLLTPPAVVRQRVRAAAQGDFVVAFYNPQSLRRRTLLREACETLAGHRPAQTPVAVGRNLGRPDEAVTVTTLAAFDPETVDMLSIVIVGNSETRAIGLPRGTGLYTPRGYAAKQPDAEDKKEMSGS